MSLQVQNVPTFNNDLFSILRKLLFLFENAVFLFFLKILLFPYFFSLPGTFGRRCMGQCSCRLYHPRSKNISRKKTAKDCNPCSLIFIVVVVVSRRKTAKDWYLLLLILSISMVVVSRKGKLQSMQLDINSCCLGMAGTVIMCLASAVALVDGLVSPFKS